MAPAGLVLLLAAPYLWGVILSSILSLNLVTENFGTITQQFGMFLVAYLPFALGMGFPLAALWSLGSLALAGAPLGLLLGRAMRRVPSVMAQLMAFAGLGLVVGAATSALAAQGTPLAIGESSALWGLAVPALVFAAITAIAAGLGRGSAILRAQRSDAVCRASEDYAPGTSI